MPLYMYILNKAISIRNSYFSRAYST